MGCDVAVRAGEVGQGRSPGRRIRAGIGVGDVTRDGRAWEEPDTDAFLSQLRRIYLQRPISIYEHPGRPDCTLTPPPLALNSGPYVLGGPSTPQPALLFVPL